MRRKSLLPVLVIAAAALLLFVWLARRSGEAEPAETAVGEVERPSPAGEAASSASATAAITDREPAPRQIEPEPEPAPPAPASTEATERALVEAVKGWVSAWSERRVDDYLACYAQSFEPEGRLGRRQWEAQRRERLLAPRFVRVAITGLETEMLEPGSARATFLQYYRSDGYSDTVRKTLELVWENGRWRIWRERAADTP